MDQNVLVSVIIPVYNVEKYLGRCIESVLCQTYGNLEIILVDDGAKDSSGSLCDEYAKKDSRIQVIHKENGGLSSARNAGIDIAGGEFLSFVDSDDWLEPDAIENLLAVARVYDVDLVCGGRYDVNEASGKKRPGLCPSRQEVISAVEMVGKIFTWNDCDSAAWDKLYHRRLFREIRFPFGKVCEDVPVMYRIVMDAERVGMCSKPVYNYYHRQGSITTSSISEKTFHFSEHTASIYPYICQNYPQLSRQARYLRVSALMFSVQSVDLASPVDRKKYRKEGKAERRALRAHTGFILTSPLFDRRKRITCLLLAFGMYRPAREVLTRNRK